MARIPPDARIYWLLSLTYAGRVWRWSSSPVAPATRAGVAVSHLGGLSPLELDDGVTLFSSSPALRSLGVEVVWPEDVAQIVAGGHPLDAATGEISLWAEGTAYEDRRVVLVGAVTRPEYGADGEPVSLSIQEQTYDDLGTLLPPEGVVSSATWSTYLPSEEGAVYPLVYGSPGIGTELGGTPALVVDYTAGTPEYADVLLIAGHPTAAGRDGATVIVRGTTLGDQLLTAYHTTDLLGRVVTCVDVTGVTVIGWRQAYPYSVSWRNTAGVLWGTIGGPVTQLGQALAWLLSQCQLALDVPRALSLIRRLRAIEVGGYVDDLTVSAWQVLSDNLLPLAPISIVSGPEGLAPLVWVWDEERTDLAHLVVGAGVERVSRVSYERDRSEVVTEVSVAYARDALSGDHTASVVLTATSDTATGQIRHALAEAGQRAYGVRRISLETDVLWRESDAVAVAAGVLRASQGGLRRVQVAGGQELAELGAGDQVLLTDATVHLTAARCLVSGIRWAGGTVALDLLLLP